MGVEKCQIAFLREKTTAVDGTFVDSLQMALTLVAVKPFWAVELSVVDFDSLDISRLMGNAIR